MGFSALVLAPMISKKSPLKRVARRGFPRDGMMSWSSSKEGVFDVLKTSFHCSDRRK